MTEVWLFLNSHNVLCYDQHGKVVLSGQFKTCREEVLTRTEGKVCDFYLINLGVSKTRISRLAFSTALREEGLR